MAGTPNCASVDPELFFPVTREEMVTNLGLTRPICSSCSMLRACNQYALDNPDLEGIWAGKYRVSRGFRTAKIVRK